MEIEEITGVAINVGSQTKYHGRGPIYADGTFEFVPIPEDDSTVSYPTYEELNLHTKQFDSVAETVVHADPEFPELPYGKQYSYGDRHGKKTQSLKKLQATDFVFFYGTLDYEGERTPDYWINTDWGGYVFGHFELATDPIIGKNELEEAPDIVRENLSNNAHLRRATLDEDIVLLVGDPGGSQLYDKPLPLTFPDDTIPYQNRANDVVNSDGTRAMSAWYRGPLEFDQDTTRKLLNAAETGEYHRLLYSDVTRLPGFERFDNALSSPSTFADVRELFERCETEEEQLFASFSYIAGGWSKKIPSSILENVERPISSPDQVIDTNGIQSLLEEVFEELGAESGWPHSHRWYYPISAGHYRDKSEGEALEVGKSRLFLEILRSFPYESFTTFVEDVVSVENGFERGFEEIRDPVESFGRTPAFDWMEALVTAHGYATLAPRELKWKYVAGDNSNPRKGLKLVYRIPSISAMDDDDHSRKESMLERLVDYARNSRGISTAKAVFGVESALCICQKGVDDVTAEDVDQNTPGSPPC